MHINDTGPDQCRVYGLTYAGLIKQTSIFLFYCKMLIFGDIITVGGKNKQPLNMGLDFSCNIHIARCIYLEL